jgi:hypothetical protein
MLHRQAQEAVLSGLVRVDDVDDLMIAMTPPRRSAGRSPTLDDGRIRRSERRPRGREAARGAVATCPATPRGSATPLAVPYLRRKPASTGMAIPVM